MKTILLSVSLTFASYILAIDDEFVAEEEENETEFEQSQEELRVCTRPGAACALNELRSYALQYSWDLLPEIDVLQKKLHRLRSKMARKLAIMDAFFNE